MAKDYPPAESKSPGVRHLRAVESSVDERIENDESALRSIAHLLPNKPSEEGKRWGVVVSVLYPEGVQRHPRLPDVVRDAVGRICATDSSEQEHFRFSFGAFGELEEEAREDARMVVGAVLARLGLDQESVGSTTLIDHSLDPVFGDDGRHLAAVPEDND